MDVETLSAKLADAGAALKATGNTGSRAQATEAELSQAKADLGTVRAQLAQALADVEKTNAKSADAQARFDVLASAKASEVASARQALDAANVASVDEKKKDVAWAASLEKELAARNAEAETLSAKLSDAMAALKTTGDTGAKVASLSAQVCTGQDGSSGAAARDQIAQSHANNEALSAKLAAAEAGLKTAGDSGAKAAALAAELASSRQALEAATPGRGDRKEGGGLQDRCAREK